MAKDPSSGGWGGGTVSGAVSGVRASVWIHSTKLGMVAGASNPGCGGREKEEHQGLLASEQASCRATGPVRECVPEKYGAERMIKEVT